VGGQRRGEFLLGLLRRLTQPLDGALVLGEVHTLLVLHLADQPLDDALVPVVSTELVVAVGGLDLDRGEPVVVLAHLEEGDVEGAATEVEDEDELVLLALLEAIGQRRGGGLVDDAQDVEAGDLAGVLRGLALGVVEVGGHRDDGVRDGLAEVGLRVCLQLSEDAGADLLRGVVLALDRGGPVGAHVALDRADGVVHVGDGLPLGDLTDQDLAGLREGDDGRRGPGAFGVRDDGGLATLEDGHHRVGGTEVDSDRTCHVCVSLFVASGLSADLSLYHSSLTGRGAVCKLPDADLSLSGSTCGCGRLFPAATPGRERLLVHPS